MNRFVFASAALMLLAVFGYTANLDASPPHGHPAHVAPAHGHVAPAHLHVAPAHVHVAAHTHALVIHGHSVNVSVRLHGYHGWSSRCWFPTYNTYGYYCGEDATWYYWYAPFNEYLPISYMSIYPPTMAVAPVTVAPIVPGVPVLPPGASYVPGPIMAP
jgi:hypothetical protein